MRRAAFLPILLLAACQAQSHQGGAPTAEEPAVPAEEAEPGVILLGDGLALPDGAGRIAFDTPAEDALAWISRVLGEPADKVRNDECGAGPMDMAVFNDGLMVNFQDGKFVGWFLDGYRDRIAIATDKGVTTESPASAFIAEHGGERVEDSTLDGEYSSDGGIGAFMAEGGATPVVEALYAGTNCFFR